MSRLAFLALTLGSLTPGLAGCARPALDVRPERAGTAEADGPRTRAEASGYTETTRYEEVLAFLGALRPRDGRMHSATMGYTSEGRRLPLVVWGDVADGTPEAVRASGKVAVYVQANIHAGEVEGKEAMLVLLRDLANGAHGEWADSLVLLVAPIYNADGNERVSLTNRPLQLGPVGGMGQRPNAQGLDLNRDMMKLASPEARSLVATLAAYEPAVVVDLHTTNGSTHGYHLTYSPGLHPSTPAPITRFLRERLFPAVTEAIRARNGWETYYYGNVNERPGFDGWSTFDHRPRFVTNYAGLRGHVSILSEAYSYAPFDERIGVTVRFVEEVLEYAYAHAAEVRALVAGAPTGEPLALRSRFGPATPATILLDDAAEEPNPYTGEIMLRRAGRLRPTPMNEYGTFEPAETTALPAAYLVPDTMRAVLDRLAAHGIAFLPAPEGPHAAERFRVDSSRVAARAFQGARERTLFGAYERAAVRGRGYRIVEVAGPRAYLIGALLEPRSDDGLAAWGLLDGALAGQRYYPILRVPAGPGRN